MRIVTIIVLLVIVQISCSDDKHAANLQGTWVDTENQAFQFIEFYSSDQGRFGYFGKDLEQYINFNYRVFDQKIALDVIGDDRGETIHDLIFDGDDKIEISVLTNAGSNALTKYQRYTIKTEALDNEIVLGKNDVYFDLENGFRLQVYCNGDSRCPEGAQCVWEGYASAQFNLVFADSSEHRFSLVTGNQLSDGKGDTTLQHIHLKLVNIIPGPELNTRFEDVDYKVKVIVSEE